MDRAPQNLRVLVVDDSAVARAALSEMLEELGYTPVAVPSALEAMEAIDGEEIDLVLTDLVMPEMDGIGLLAEIKKTKPELPVILITEYASLSSAVDALRRGADDYLTKPTGTELLGHRIGVVLNRRRLVKEKAERNRLEGALAMAGAAAHELNQPLTVILGAAELMTQIDDPAKLKKLAERVAEAAERLGDITQRLAKVVRFKTQSYLGRKNIIDLEAATED